jgi:hypothetical protein
VDGVPGRLEDPVEEPESDDPVDQLVGQEMVDAQDRGLGQLDPQDPVQVLCRLKVGPERQ